jgi:phosphotransferase system IIA component
MGDDGLNFLLKFGIDTSKLKLEVGDWLLIKNKKQLKVVEIVAIENMSFWSNSSEQRVVVRNTKAVNKYQYFNLRESSLIRKVPKNSDFNTLDLLYVG